ncbi:MAG: anti-sigma factor [Pseudomonadota bacterium]
MTQYQEKLSAFLDGELSEAETHEIEEALTDDPVLQAQLEALMAVDAQALKEFDAMLEDPVPLGLVAAIKETPERVPANSPRAPSLVNWFTAAAAFVALGLGGATGYFTGLTQGTQVVAAPGWLSDIADYHEVYAGQTRHLVEVAANEADHIQTWLSNTVGSEVRIPDLSEHGLTFQGARLVVAAGKPVSQLMYTDANMRVVALCQIQSDAPRDGFEERSINAYDMVTWGSRNANFVIVGDEGRPDLNAIAQTAAVQA